MSLPRMWCATCREWTVLIDTGDCPWCSSPLQHDPDAPALAALPTGEDGGRPRAITSSQTHAAHAEHLAGRSIRSLAIEHWQDWGYSGPSSAHHGLTRAFRTLGLPVRGRRSRLTVEQAREIRARYQAGGIKQSDLAAEYGVSPQTISDLVRRTEAA